MKFEIDNIELKFNSTTILNGIYLRAEIGKITGILGSNGSGKSSLLKIFFGSLHPFNKLIRINEKPHLSPLFKSGLVKYLPQHSLVPANFHLRKAFDLYHVSWNEFASAFPDFRKYETCRMNELSGGEIRMVEIYLSLKSASKLVLLDEPFSHLAPVLVEKLELLLNEEKKNKAIILTDHLYRPVVKLADELYLLKDGSSRIITDLKDLEKYRYLNPHSF